MKIIFVNGFELNVESIFSIGEVRTIVDDPANISTIAENLTDENLYTVILEHDAFYEDDEPFTEEFKDVTCTDMVVTEFNSSAFIVTLHLHEKSVEELYADAGRILLGEIE